MTVLEGWAILQDKSGIDRAEFSRVDADPDDSCFRAYPFQRHLWRDLSPLQIDQSARSVGKRLSIKVRAFAFPFNWPGSEMVITGPEDVHVDAITDLIETQFYATRLGREMLAGRGSVKHKPFHANYNNGARIMGRIAQRDGSEVKGVHSVQLLTQSRRFPRGSLSELSLGATAQARRRSSTDGSAMRSCRHPQPRAIASAPNHEQR